MTPFNKTINIGTLLLYAYMSMLFGCTKAEQEPTAPSSGSSLSLSEVRASLISDDHTAEGFMVTLNDGRIVHFFRLDPGMEGDHVGNGGRIVRRVSADNGKTWSATETVYNDQWDCRNTRGVLTEDGKIVVFFRRFMPETYTTVDLNYIVSIDGGETWNARRALPFTSPVSVVEYQIGAPVALGSNCYLVPAYGLGYCEMRRYTVADDSLVFAPGAWVFDHAQTRPLGIDEPYCTMTTDGKVMCLFRDERKAAPGYSDPVAGANYYQSVSSNGGETWSLPEKTNIAEPSFCAHPLLIYESALAEPLVAIATDRERPYESNRIWIYSSTVDAVFHTPDGWKLLSVVDRPRPVDYRLYGYPCATRMKNGHYLVVFTESSHDGINEDADLYQFELNIN